jgi:hypothetical protein
MKKLFLIIILTSQVLFSELYFRVATNPLVLAIISYDINLDIVIHENLSFGGVYLKQFGGLNSETETLNQNSLEINTKIFFDSFDTNNFYLKFGLEKNYSSLSDTNEENLRDGEQNTYRATALLGYQWVTQRSKNIETFTSLGFGYSEQLKQYKNIKYGNFKQDELNYINTKFRFEFFYGIIF